jgi:hypothetical protein
MTLAFVVSTAGVLVAQSPSYAGSKGRRNTMYGLAGVTIWQALEGKTTNAILGGVGTAIAYHQYKKARKKEKRLANARYYSSLRRGRSYYHPTRRYRRVSYRR